MCDPTLGMVALNAVGTVAGIQSQNSHSAAVAANARQAANNQYAAESSNYVQQNRALIQGGFDAILEGRAKEAIAYTSAIENNGAGNSLRAVLADRRGKTGRGMDRFAQEADANKAQLDTKFKSIETQAAGRMASAPPTSFGLGDLVGIVAPIPKYGSDTLGINGLGD
jgi:hypothetical protein